METHSDPVFSLDDFTSHPISLISTITYTIQKKNNATKKTVKVKVDVASLMMVVDKAGNLFQFDLTSNPRTPTKTEQIIKNTSINGKIISAR